MAPSASLATILSTSLALSEQFAASLSPPAPVDVPSTSPNSPSSLILLNAAATTLRSQVTKLSLLAITNPFTPSAVATCLTPLNESVLTSLVTAALLTTPDRFTASFSSECRALTATTLRDLQTLFRLLETRSKDGSAASDIGPSEKKAFTEATGRIWDDCDKLSPLAKDGVPGFVARKTKQWLELMKDAVQELQEWDPDDDVDADDPFGESTSDDDDEDPDHRNSEAAADTGDRAAISAGVKEQALRVLNRIPQSIHVLIKQRLEKLGPDTKLTAEDTTGLDRVLQQHRQISELIDESAEAMYLGNPELCLKRAGEARATTIAVVEAVLRPPWAISGAPTTTDTKEDKYIRRALEWVQRVEPGGPPKANTLPPR